MDLVFLINLPLGVFWLFMGGGILVYEQTNGPLRLRPLDISLGWWLMLLSLYNFSKVGRSLYAKRHPPEPPAEVPETRLARREPRPTEPPDPNFQFNERPPENK